MTSKIEKIAWAAALGAGIYLVSRAAKRVRTKYSFSGKVVLITGGSRGLGLVLARQLAREGAKIAVCARDSEELERAKIQIESIGTQALAVTADLTDRSQVNQLIRRVREELGEIDVLINNAGIIEAGPYNIMTLEDYEYAMAIHFWAPLYTMMAVIPAMRKAGCGRIVNISSVGGKVSVPHLLPYSASKFALTGLSEGLSAELKKEGIVVTTVCPSLMRTGSARNVYVKGQAKKEFSIFAVVGSLPTNTINVERAAKRIINACRYGKRELLLSFQTKLASAFHGVFPGATTDIMAGLNKILPDSGETGAMDTKRGYESETAISQSFLTDLDKEAAKKNNEW